MKEIKLLKLRLKNFKGIRELEIAPDGADLEIYGDNGEGKTTIADAWYWLLFDKDSKGNSTQSFDIKTLGESGEVLHGLEHEVEGVLQNDDKRLTLKKVYQEKWTKKRGSAKEKFTGHTTDYFINEVPVKKSEYDQRISEIIDEDIFKLLTNPGYFNEELHWTDRREILLDVCGDVSDEDVLDSMANLQNKGQITNLTNILNSRSIKDHQEIINSKLKKINKQLEKIPTRIDEVNRNLPDISDLDKEQIKQDIQQLKKDKQEKEQELNRVKSGGEVAEKKKKLSEIETDLINLKNDYNSDRLEQIQKLKEDRSRIQDEVQELVVEKRELFKDQQANEDTIESIESAMEKLRKEWHEIESNKEELQSKEFDGDTECPTCGQKLPEGQVEEARKKFNLDKAEELKELSSKQEEINQEGQELKDKVKELQEENEQLQQEIEELEDQADELRSKMHSLSNKIDTLENKADQEPDSTDYKAKKAQKKQLETDIKGLKLDRNQKVSQLEEEIKQLETEIDAEKDKLQKIKQHDQSQERIEELKKEEENLAAKYEELEYQQHLTEKFIRTKVNMLEHEINRYFDYAEFKLFEEQVNGGIKEVCETTFEGVPYSSGLNTGSQINVGLDIINTLSKHYDFKAPIFIDNAESVTEIANIDAQIIKLIVSPNHQELSIVSESDLVDDELGVTELREIASDLGVRNYSNYKKSELIKQINKRIRLGEAV